MLLLHIFCDSCFVVLSRRGGGCTDHLFQTHPKPCLSHGCCCHLAKGVIPAAQIPAVRRSEGIGGEGEAFVLWPWWFLLSAKISLMVSWGGAGLGEKLQATPVGALCLFHCC